jgi:hypothetical protein
MGDRATFVIEQSEDTEPIFIYGHWAGDGMMNTLASALDHAKVRIDMDDPWYATRMIFGFMIQDDPLGEYGWGLSTTFLDSEHSVPVVNLTNKTVRLLPHSWDKKFDIHAEPKFVMSIDSFVNKFSKVMQPA